MFKPYIVTKTITLPAWDEATREKTKKFWSDRRMSWLESSDTVLHGERGSLLWNPFAINPGLVKATLLMTWTEPHSLDCCIHVNTAFQDMTDWTKAYFDFEMRTLETFLLEDDLQDELWKSFHSGFNLAALRWSMSGMMLGRRMSRTEWTKYAGP